MNRILKQNSLKLNSIRSLSQNETKSMNIWKRIRYVLNVYWEGSKLLYQNSKLTKQIREKSKDDWTRLEKEHIRIYSYDIRVGIPFVALFSLPIIGYSAPLIALLSPRSLPSTFILPQQKRRFVSEDADASAKIIDSLIKSNKNRFDEENLSSNLIFAEFDEKMKTGLELDEILEYSRLFSKSMRLECFPVEHLDLLHQSVVHSSNWSRKVSSKSKLCSDLESWQWNILQDDLRIDDVKNLSRKDLVLSLYRRGIYFHSDQLSQMIESIEKDRLGEKNSSLSPIDDEIVDQWTNQLEQWILIHRNLYKTNRLSTSFLLHLFPLAKRNHLKRFVFIDSNRLS